MQSARFRPRTSHKSSCGWSVVCSSSFLSVVGPYTLSFQALPCSQHGPLFRFDLHHLCVADRDSLVCRKPVLTFVTSAPAINDCASLYRASIENRRRMFARWTQHHFIQTAPPRIVGDPWGVGPETRHRHATRQLLSRLTASTARAGFEPTTYNILASDALAPRGRQGNAALCHLSYLASAGRCHGWGKNNRDTRPCKRSLVGGRRERVDAARSCRLDNRLML